MSAFLDPGFWSFVLVMAGIYAIFALGLQLEYGFAGLMNFGHVASMALAAYTLAILVVRAHMSFWLAALAGVAVAVLGNVLLGLTSLRLRGDYFAIVTIAFSEIVRYVAITWQSLTGGPQGTIAMGGPSGSGTYTDTWDAVLETVQGWLGAAFGTEPSRDVTMLVIVWAVALPLLALAQLLTRSPWGRALRAIREDEDLARAVGKPSFSLKLQALGLGAALGGLAGVLYAVQFSFFSPEDFAPLTTFFAWIIILLGGTARVWAVPVGAIVFGFIFAGTRFFDFPPFSWIDSADRAYLRLIIIGVLLIAIVYFRPAGLLGRPQEVADA
ncbi:MAG: branched-chain amino acid ABC transporter permease [Angustibacter sp.]